MTAPTAPTSPTSPTTQSENTPGPIEAGVGWRTLRKLEAGAFTLKQKQYAPTFRQGLHAHDRGSVDFNLAGSGAGRNAGAAVDSRAGVVELFPPGVEHSFACGAAGMRTLHVSFGRACFDDRERGPGDPDGRRIDQSAAIGLAARLLREISDPDESSPLVAEGLGHELLAATVRWRDKPDPSGRWLSWVRDRLHDGGAPSLQELARLAGVHRAHLARSFSARYGVSVGEYHRRLRLTAASRALSRSVTPIARLARDHGFSDQAHLTRWFTRELGIAPAGFARLMRNERDGLRAARWPHREA